MLCAPRNTHLGSFNLIIFGKEDKLRIASFMSSLKGPSRLFSSRYTRKLYGYKLYSLYRVDTNFLSNAR